MIFAFAFAAVLLLAGVVLRHQIGFFRVGRIPASLIGGAIGLVIVQAFQFGGSDAMKPVTTIWSDWPSTLIAVVFAGMLLGKRGSRAGDSSRHRVRDVVRQSLMVWIIVLGQTVVGLWVTWWILKPQFGLPDAAGMLIESGFAGGHGTAAAMGIVFEHPTIDWAEGFDLAVMMATGGLVYGLVSGVIWIQLALKIGWVQVTTPDESRAIDSISADAEPSPEPSLLGRSRVDAGVVDPLLFQVIWLALAMGVGVGLQTSVGWIADWASPTPVLESVDSTAADSTAADSKLAGEMQLKSRLSLASVVGSFPLFIYTLFGGFLVRFGVDLVGQSRAIDSQTIHRISGSAMDALVVAAVATLNLSAVASLWIPLAIVFLAGSIWSTFCLLVLSRRILPVGKWFQLGLINFGMSTGTTATGFVLLRVIDPDLESGAAEDYALAAPFSAPFIGGGMITVALPLLVFPVASIAWPTLILTAVLLVLIALGVRSRRSD